MPAFRPVMRGEKFDDIPLFKRPEFQGGILESDRTMDIETKEITSTPSTERKDEEVKSGIKPPCTDGACQHAGSWHVHEGGGVRGAGRS